MKKNYKGRGLTFKGNMILHSEKDDPFLFVHPDGSFDLNMVGYIIVSPNNPQYKDILKLIKEETHRKKK
jgi:hypothetical protein